MRVKDNYCRLYLNADLAEHNIVALNKQDAHYLSIVLKIRDRQLLKVFNEVDGEFLAEFIADKKSPQVLIAKFLRPAHSHKYTHLGICIVKNAIMSDIIDKAVQLGVTHITPIISTYTQNREFNIERYSKIIKEAAEQSNRCDMPQIFLPQKLDDFLQQEFDLMMFANETQEHVTVLNIQKWPEKVALLIGPEGGFSDLEIQKLSDIAHSITLGPSILRSETAVIALLAQMSLVRNY
jgi:16S rRNA (uracil1498-N3)-methyltransferase